MKSTSSWLSLVLVLQIAVAGGIFLSKQHSSEEQNPTPLISYANSDLDKIVISDATTKVVLKKAAGTWILPEYQKLPVNEKKLDDILQNLNGLQGGWPVATSASSHERFEVDEDKFQKRVQLYSGDTSVGELFIGTSPGYRKAHVRSEGDDKVYTADISSFEYSVKPADWLNKELLLTSAISTIEAKDYVLQKQGDAWSFGDKTSDEAVDSEKANALAGAIEKLHIQELADVNVNKAKVNKSTEMKVIAGGKNLTYSFFTEDDKHYVKRSDFEPVFVITKTAFDNIIQKSVSDLAVKIASPKEKAAVEPESNS